MDGRKEMTAATPVKDDGAIVRIGTIDEIIDGINYKLTPIIRKVDGENNVAESHSPLLEALDAIIYKLRILYTSIDV